MLIDTERKLQIYQVNIVAFIELAKWLEMLKEQGVYDNTRIILVSDHGNAAGMFPEMDLRKEGLPETEHLAALLMMKDFNSRGSLYKNNTFMTNADVPLMALDGLVDHPMNPFTGKALESGWKEDPQIVCTSSKWDVRKNNGTVFDTRPEEWFTITENIYDKTNWKQLRMGD